VFDQENDGLVHPNVLELMGCAIINGFRKWNMMAPLTTKQLKPVFKVLMEEAKEESDWLTIETMAN